MDHCLLFSWLVFSFSLTINQTVYAAPTDRQRISFFMQDVLAMAPPRRAHGNAGLLGPGGGIFPSVNGAAQPRPVGRGSPFATTLPALELGMVSIIDDVLTEGCTAGSPMVGRARGIVVSSSQAREARMIAMTASFDENGEVGDSLRFFGLHRPGALGSRIAVIGGTGRYREANGFATVVVKQLESNNTSLLLTVYLK